MRTIILVVLFGIALVCCNENSTSSSVSYASTEPALTGSMNGYEWNKATDANKRVLVANISRQLNEKSLSDCSANFLYDALNEAFNTNDSAILKGSIAEAVGLCVTMAQSLPKNQRDY